MGRPLKEGEVKPGTMRTRKCREKDKTTKADALKQNEAFKLEIAVLRSENEDLNVSNKLCKQLIDSMTAEIADLKIRPMDGASFGANGEDPPSAEAFKKEIARLRIENSSLQDKCHLSNQRNDALTEELNQFIRAMNKGASLERNGKVHPAVPNQTSPPLSSPTQSHSYESDPGYCSHGSSNSPTFSIGTNRMSESETCNSSYTRTSRENSMNEEFPENWLDEEYMLSNIGDLHDSVFGSPDPTAPQYDVEMNPPDYQTEENIENGANSPINALAPYPPYYGNYGCQANEAENANHMQTASLTPIGVNQNCNEYEKPYESQQVVMYNNPTVTAANGLTNQVHNNFGYQPNVNRNVANPVFALQTTPPQLGAHAPHINSNRGGLVAMKPVFEMKVDFSRTLIVQSPDGLVFYVQPTVVSDPIVESTPPPSFHPPDRPHSMCLPTGVGPPYPPVQQ